MFLTVESFLEALDRGPEKIFLIQPEISHQASHGRGMVLDMPVTMNVFDSDPVPFEDSRDEHATMTVEWFLFGAHDSDSLALRTVPQALDAALEIRGPGKKVVPHPSVDIAGEVSGTRAQFLSQEDVLNIDVGQDTLHSVSIELGRESTDGHRPHIGDCSDSMLLQ
ncbi:hypothetical protein OG912_08865 [Streptomyces sp. NBC_00464]